MKIAITGHKKGIGKEFAKQLSARGHTIVGISRSDGENIRRVPHTASLIEQCELFINNAQTGYYQTELLYEVWKRWKGKEKYIWNISSMMAESPVNLRPDGQDDILMSQYHSQKITMDTAARQLRHKSNWPMISTIKPGGVATQPNWSKDQKMDTALWVQSVLDIFTHNDNIKITEITVAWIEKRIPI